MSEHLHGDDAHSHEHSHGDAKHSHEHDTGDQIEASRSPQIMCNCPFIHG